MKRTKLSKRAHATDLRQTAKGEKRQRLIDYITKFAIEADCVCKRENYNRAWGRLWKKIDGLKLFE